jgi:hypothetical protein
MGRGEVRKQAEYPVKDMEQCLLYFDDMRAADCKKSGGKGRRTFSTRSKEDAEASSFCYTSSQSRMVWCCSRAAKE